MKQKWSTQRGQGRGIRFLREHVNYKGDACLIWPMSRDQEGYGILGYDGKRGRAARVMCELVNGPPPTPKYETAHSCGRGDMGCVHPQHVSWKTTSGNQFDSIAHGTFYKKNGWHPRFKLTSQQVKEIRAMKNRPSHRKLAVIYGVSADTIGKMLRGDT